MSLTLARMSLIYNTQEGAAFQYGVLTSGLPIERVEEISYLLMVSYQVLGTLVMN